MRSHGSAIARRPQWLDDRFAAFAIFLHHDSALNWTKLNAKSGGAFSWYHITIFYRVQCMCVCVCNIWLAFHLISAYTVLQCVIEWMLCLNRFGLTYQFDANQLQIVWHVCVNCFCVNSTIVHSIGFDDSLTPFITNCFGLPHLFFICFFFFVQASSSLRMLRLMILQIYFLLCTFYKRLYII